MEAKEQMKRKQKELQRAAASKGKLGSQLTGFGSMASSSSRNEVVNPIVGDTAITEPAPPKPSYPSR